MDHSRTHKTSLVLSILFLFLSKKHGSQPRQSFILSYLSRGIFVVSFPQRLLPVTYGWRGSLEKNPGFRKPASRWVVLIDGDERGVSEKGVHTLTFALLPFDV